MVRVKNTLLNVQKSADFTKETWYRRSKAGIHEIDQNLHPRKQIYNSQEIEFNTQL